MNRLFRSREAKLSDYSALGLFLVAYVAILALIVAPDAVTTALTTTSLAPEAASTE